MRNVRIVAALSTVVLAGAALAGAPAALAAGSPAVVAHFGIGRGKTGERLTGIVNPDGALATYQFEYSTSAAGLGNPAGETLVPRVPHKLRAVKAPLKVSVKLKGLTPGTVYYYKLVANNRYGVVASPVLQFKTAGTPPLPAPTDTTDPATLIDRYGATLVGTINPNGGVTTYWFEYGATTNYGYQTRPQTVPAGTAPVTVSLPLVGIQPGMLFHYRLDVSHGTAVTTTLGADVEFGTDPWPRPHSSLHAGVTTRTSARGSVRFRIRGHLGLPLGTPASLGCQGNVVVTYSAQGFRLFRGLVPIAPNCTYRASNRLGRFADGIRVRISLRFRGNTWLAPSHRHRSVTV